MFGGWVYSDGAGKSDGMIWRRWWRRWSRCERWIGGINWNLHFSGYRQRWTFRISCDLLHLAIFFSSHSFAVVLLSTFSHAGAIWRRRGRHQRQAIMIIILLTLFISSRWRWAKRHHCSTACGFCGLLDQQKVVCMQSCFRMEFDVWCLIGNCCVLRLWGWRQRCQRIHSIVDAPMINCVWSIAVVRVHAKMCELQWTMRHPCEPHEYWILCLWYFVHAIRRCKETNISIVACRWKIQLESLPAVDKKEKKKQKKQIFIANSSSSSTAERFLWHTRICSRLLNVLLDKM